MLQQPVVIGRLGAPHGVQGKLRLHSFTEPKENIQAYKVFFGRFNKNGPNKNGEWQQLQVDNIYRHNSGLVIKFSGIDNREQATKLVNTELAVDRSELPQLEADQHYWADLTGLKVINEDGLELGIVSGMFATGANDVLIVAKGSQKQLIPFIQEVHVIRVDWDDRVIYVNWPEEL